MEREQKIQETKDKISDSIVSLINSGVYVESVNICFKKVLGHDGGLIYLDPNIDVEILSSN